VLFIGTRAGLYRTDGPVADASVVLERPVRRVHATPAGVLAATDEGLYRSPDGRSWTDLGLPVDHVEAAASLDGRRLYAGTRPSHLFVSTDGGDTWRESGLSDHPDRPRWQDRSFRDGEAQVRTVAVHEERPDLVVAGVEPGGVLVSDDRGETWERRSEGLHDDVHHVLVRGDDEWVAATGNGLYRTGTAGETWLRMDTEFREFWYNYYRESVVADDVLHTAARGWGPEEPGSVILEWDGDRPQRVRPPCHPDAFVVAWTVREGRVLAGTLAHDDRLRPDDPAALLAREGGTWRTVAEFPAAVKSLATL